MTVRVALIAASLAFALAPLAAGATAPVSPIGSIATAATGTVEPAAIPVADFQLRSGRPAGTRPGFSPHRPRPERPAKTYRREPDRSRPHRPGKHWPKHRRDRFWPRAIPFIYGERDDDPETVIVEVPVPVPVPPAPVEEAAPPPDPRGAIRLMPARGASAAVEGFEVGQRIAPERPVVVLDWRRHGLPEPGPGETWIRVDREVLRIDATTRAVLGHAPEPERAEAAD